MPDPERALSLDGAPPALFLVFVLLLLVVAFDADEESEAIDEDGAVGAGVLAGIGVYISNKMSFSGNFKRMKGSTLPSRLILKAIRNHVSSHQVLCLKFHNMIDGYTVARDSSIRGKEPKRNHDMIISYENNQYKIGF